MPQYKCSLVVHGRTFAIPQQQKHHWAVAKEIEEEEEGGGERKEKKNQSTRLSRLTTQHDATYKATRWTSAAKVSILLFFVWKIHIFMYILCLGEERREEKRREEKRTEIAIGRLRETVGCRFFSRCCRRVIWPYHDCAIKTNKKVYNLKSRESSRVESLHLTHIGVHGPFSEFYLETNDPTEICARTKFVI